MLPRRTTRLRSGNKEGAVAGSILRGSGLSNQGLRLKIMVDQARGNDGPIQGTFVILDAGDNMHSQTLAALLHQEMNATRLLGIVRQQHAGCVNVVNTNILV